MKKYTKKWYKLRSVYHIMKHLYKSISNKQPLLILTIGKTASTSVYFSLNRQTSYHCFHLHSLSEKGINKQIKFHTDYDKGRIPPNVRIAQFVNKKLLRFKGNLPVVVIIRNPIDRLLSAIFHHFDKFNINSFSSDSDKNYLPALNLIISKIEEEGVWDELDIWIQEEVNEVLGIDIYSQIFDETKGYNIFNNGKISLLLLKMENLNNVFTISMQSFLNSQTHIVLESHNVGDDKVYKDEYQIIKKNLKIDKKILEKYTATKYFKHFYAGEEEKLYNRWSK